MLDVVTTGTIKGIANEAPVPVFLESATRYSLGGSGNVCANLRALGGTVYPVGLLGDDEAAGRVAGLLAERAISTAGLIVDPRCPTICKRRYYVNRSLVFRADKEQPFAADQEELLFVRFADFYHAAAAATAGQKVKVILSDYAKGTLSAGLIRRVLDFCREVGVQSFVDPKAPLGVYRGCTFMKPNAAEARRLGGIRVTLDSLGEAHAHIRTLTDCEWSLVTLAEHGMSLGCPDNRHIHQAVDESIDDIDVTGAGDVVLSTMATLWDRGISYEACLGVANYMGRATVTHHGTYVVTAKDIEGATTGSAPQQRVVFTNGCFDILHRGHLTLLAAAKALGTHLIVGINSDASVRRLKGPTRPIQDQETRAAMLAALPWVDEVRVFDEDTPERLLAEIRPAVLVKGGDYQADQVLGREYAGEVRIVPFIEGNSTTSIVAAINGKGSAAAMSCKGADPLQARG